MSDRQFPGAKRISAVMFAMLVAVGLSLAGAANATIDKDKDGSKRLSPLTSAAHGAQVRRGHHGRRHGVPSHIARHSAHPPR